MNYNVSKCISSLVVHAMKAPYDIYIGRPNKQIASSVVGSDGQWGNPFKPPPNKQRNKSSKHAINSKVVEQYRKWILDQPQLCRKAR